MDAVSDMRRKYLDLDISHIDFANIGFFGKQKQKQNPCLILELLWHGVSHRVSKNIEQNHKISSF